MAVNSLREFEYLYDIAELPVSQKTCLINPLTPRRTLVAPFTKISILF